MFGKLAVSTGLYPLLEYTNGILNASSIREGFQAKPVSDYLKQQGRFKHLKEEDIITIQNLADENIKRYKL
jgi:pyruvate/2-oxoacid:ferredoxin oxidoreductase beta subunit